MLNGVYIEDLFNVLQITTYTHKDENNKWLIKPYNKEPSNDIKILKNGDLVRLEHTQTKRNLHSHRETAPLTKKHFQVTGYGEVSPTLFLVYHSFKLNFDYRMALEMQMIFGKL